MTLHRNRLRGGDPVVGTLVSAVLAFGALAIAPEPSFARCINTLPVTNSFPSDYAASYSKTLPITVRTRGPAIRKLEAKLYTFGGDLLGRERAKRTVRNATTLRMRLRFPMQPGRYTLTLFGEPNADPSCGPKHTFRVVRFRDCPLRLPVTFPQLPRGRAVDYGGLMTVRVASKGPLLRDVDVTLSRFDGTQLGVKRFRTLFGTVAANFSFSGGVPPGDYSVSVRGRISRQPESCDDATASTTLRLT